MPAGVGLRDNVKRVFEPRGVLYRSGSEGSPVTMPPLQTLYPLGLAAANVAVGWLLYGVLEADLGALLASVGVVVLLAVVHETFRPATRRTSTLSQRLARPTADEAPPDRIR